MSLTDIDRNSDDRSRPTLNAPDRVDIGAVRAHATEGIAYRSEEATSTPRVTTKDDQLIVNDGDSNIALFGRDGAGNYVVKVAKDGFDVLTATDSQLAFNSAQNTLKVVTTNTTTITTSAGGPSDRIITHNLGFIPIPLVYMDLPGGGGTRVTLPYIETGPSGIEIEAYVNSTQLTIYSRVADPFGPQTYSIRYYLLQETAS